MDDEHLLHPNSAQNLFLNSPSTSTYNSDSEYSIHYNSLDFNNYNNNSDLGDISYHSDNTSLNTTVNTKKRSLSTSNSNDYHHSRSNSFHSVDYLSDSSPQPSNKKSKQGASSSFVPKLFAMVNDINSNNLINWNLTGTSFIVANLRQFSNKVLPNHFKHSNFSSFVRQLNMYGFHKCNKTPRGQKSQPEHQVWEFSHPKFLKDRPDLLDDIKRKVFDSNSFDGNFSTSNNFNNSNYNSNRSTDFASSLALLQVNQNNTNQSIHNLNQRCNDLNQQLTASKNENQHLKNVVKQMYAFLYGTYSGLPFDYPSELLPSSQQHTTSSDQQQKQQLDRPPIFITSADSNQGNTSNNHSDTNEDHDEFAETNAQATTPLNFPYSPSTSIHDPSHHSSPYGNEYSPLSYTPLSPLSIGPNAVSPSTSNPNHRNQLSLTVDTSYSPFYNYNQNSNNANNSSNNSNNNHLGLGIISPSASSDPHAPNSFDSRRLSTHSHTFSSTSSIPDNINMDD